METGGIDFGTNFTILDWVIVGAYLLGTLVIGIYVNRYIRSMADYVVAGRALKSRLGIATMIGTELGLVTIMYAAQKGFTGGFAAMHIGLVAAIVTLLVGLTGFIVVPLRAAGVMTIPEFYERRFGRGVRLFGGAVLALAGVLNMGLFIKAGGVFVQGITGLGGEEAVVLNLIMTAMLVLVLAYTILGGMVSVIITDYLQFVVLSFGLLGACAAAIAHAGGWAPLIDAVRSLKQDAGFDPLEQEGGFGVSYVLWMVLLGLGSCAVWQTAVMRACAAESTRVVKRLYAWSSIGFLIRMMIPQFLGICALAWVAGRPELLEHFGEAESSLGAMPFFLGKILPAGIIGIITAGMLAAFMSTHDSYLLSWSAVLTQDVVGPLTGDRLSTRARLLLTRAFIFLIGVFILVWGLWYPLGQDLWDYLAVSGTIYYAGGFAVLIFGIYWRRASRAGALLAIAAGLTAVLGLKPLQEVLGIGEIRSEYIALGAAGLATLFMVAGSALLPDRDRDDRERARIVASAASMKDGRATLLVVTAVAAVILGMALLSGSWSGFWKALLVVTLSLFAVLAVAVAYGGLLDIRSMLRAIEDRHRGESAWADGP